MRCASMIRVYAVILLIGEGEGGLYRREYFVHHVIGLDFAVSKV